MPSLEADTFFFLRLHLLQALCPPRVTGVLASPAAHSSKQQSTHAAQGAEQAQGDGALLSLGMFFPSVSGDT